MEKKSQQKAPPKGKEDFECPICLEVAAEPVRTPCNHLFCLSCQKQSIQRNQTCPMCRRQFDAQFVPQVDRVLQEELKESFPEDFQERKEQLVKAGLWRGNKMTIMFEFGNLHSLEKNPKPANSDASKVNMHRWMMFISLGADKEATGKFIESVTYHLHPTFKPSKITVSEQPFILSRLGWGYFEVNVEIKFKSWTQIPKMELDHMVSFENGGSKGRFFVELEKEWIEKIDNQLVQKMNGLTLKSEESKKE